MNEDEYNAGILSDFLRYKSLHEFEVRKTNELKRLKESGASKEIIKEKKDLIDFVSHEINHNI